MGKPVSVIVSIALALLCWLALDDITTGSEPGYTAEWTVVAATALWFGGLAWRRRVRS